MPSLYSQIVLSFLQIKKRRDSAMDMMYKLGGNFSKGKNGGLKKIVNKNLIDSRKSSKESSISNEQLSNLSS